MRGVESLVDMESKYHDGYQVGDWDKIFVFLN